VPAEMLTSKSTAGRRLVRAETEQTQRRAQSPARSPVGSSLGIDPARSSLTRAEIFGTRALPSTGCDQDKREGDCEGREAKAKLQQQHGQAPFGGSTRVVHMIERQPAGVNCVGDQIGDLHRHRRDRVARLR
jgi:hypothetical protein